MIQCCLSWDLHFFHAADKDFSERNAIHSFESIYFPFLYSGSHCYLPSFRFISWIYFRGIYKSQTVQGTQWPSKQNWTNFNFVTKLIIINIECNLCGSTILLYVFQKKMETSSLIKSMLFLKVSFCQMLLQIKILWKRQKIQQKSKQKNIVGRRSNYFGSSTKHLCFFFK